MHEAISTLFHQDGVPPAMIMDGAKEERLSTFGRKCRQANCYMRPTEPYSPWQNMAEGCVREVKRASSRDMLWTGSPKRLWDHSLKLRALIRSHTALDIYDLRGQVPEAVMKGDSPDISHLCEFSWYDWVWYNDNPST